MADFINLPADLPTDWAPSQIVSPDGVSAGLTEKHGFIYLMEQVNKTQLGVNDAHASLSNKVNGSFRIYSTLEDIGLTHGTETLESIFSAMASSSELIVQIGPDSNSSIYPSPSWGVLEIVKFNNNRNYAKFTIKSDPAYPHRQFVGGFWDASGIIKFSGWELVVVAGKPKVWTTLPAINGYAPVTRGFRYALNEDKTVSFEGAFTKGTATFTGGQAFTLLPVGVRPAQNEYVVCVGTGATPWATVVDINADGNVKWNGHTLPPYNAGSHLVIRAKFSIV